MKNRHFVDLILALGLLVGCGGGGSQQSTPAVPVNGSPTATGVSPSSVSAGAFDTTITISGSSFISGSIANFNNQPLKTTFISASQLSAVIPAADLTSGVIGSITVTNPPPGGGISGAGVVFTVNNPAPTLTQVSPSSIGAGSSSPLTATGTGFVPTSTLVLDAQPIATAFISASQLQATIPTGNLAGTHSVAVLNPSPGGGSSQSASFQIHINVVLIPSTATWRTSSAHTLRAVALGTNAGNLNWQVVEAGGGSILPTGSFDSLSGFYFDAYSSPAAAGTFHVKATSQDDPSQSATATVIVSSTAGAFSLTGTSVGKHGQDFAVTLLQNGNVLLTGGDNAAGIAELYNATTGQFNQLPSMLTPRAQHTSTLLNSGQVLLCGGIDQSLAPVSSCELFDPATNTFHPAAAMSSPRHNHSTTLLANGNVLITGGSTQSSRSAEIYDPASNTFKPAGQMLASRVLAGTALLSTGKVLIAGGADPNTGGGAITAELYDPALNAFSQVGNMSVPREGPTVTVLGNGKVLVTGTVVQGETSAVADLFDPTTNTFTRTANMQLPRCCFTASPLPNGGALIAGGISFSEIQLAAEIYDPASGTFSFTDTMHVHRFLHRAVNLPSGTVLVVGGDSNAGESSQPTDLYTP